MDAARRARDGGKRGCAGLRSQNVSRQCRGMDRPDVSRREFGTEIDTLQHGLTTHPVFAAVGKSRRRLGIEGPLTELLRKVEQSFAVPLVKPRRPRRGYDQLYRRSDLAKIVLPRRRLRNYGERDCPKVAARALKHLFETRRCGGRRIVRD